jgi:hypothetical protein
MRAFAGVVCVAALGGCTLITDSFLTNDFSGDPFPIDVDTSSGALIVGLRQDARPDRSAVLDLLSPFTVIDSGPASRPSVSYFDVTLLGARGPGGPLDLPRARFRDAQVLALHPCASDPCTVGTPSAPRAYDAIVGADVLAGDAVRLQLGGTSPRLFVLPDVGGTDAGRTASCDAVFSSPYRGGGTLVLGGTELGFGNRRIVLRACLGPVEDLAMALPQSQRGADALLVVSTGIGITILDEGAYERYRVTHRALAPPLLAALPVDSAYLPSGLVTGRRARLDAIALVGAPAGNALAPCRQVYAHRLQTTYKIPTGGCRPDSTGVIPYDCPCKNAAEFCGVPAIVELRPASKIDVLIVPDADPTLQALRTELRPDQAEVDGILGTDALRAAELDIDYPHDRLLARCPDASCVARPLLSQLTDVCAVNQCITGLAEAPGCAGELPDAPMSAPTPRDE